MENLNKYLKFSSTGDVDVDATMVEIRVDLEKFAALQKSDLESISTAVNAVFDQYPGTNLNLPFVATKAADKLNVGPAAHEETCERIKNYVRNAKSLFEITKGRGGGCRRLSTSSSVAAE